MEYNKKLLDIKKYAIKKEPIKGLTGMASSSWNQFTDFFISVVCKYLDT